MDFIRVQEENIISSKIISMLSAKRDLFIFQIIRIVWELHSGISKNSPEDPDKFNPILRVNQEVFKLLFIFVSFIKPMVSSSIFYKIKSKKEKNHSLFFMAKCPISM